MICSVCLIAAINPIMTMVSLLAVTPCWRLRFAQMVMRERMFGVYASLS